MNVAGQRTHLHRVLPVRCRWLLVTVKARRGGGGVPRSSAKGGGRRQLHMMISVSAWVTAEAAGGGKPDHRFMNLPLSTGPSGCSSLALLVSYPSLTSASVSIRCPSPGAVITNRRAITWFNR